MKAWDPIFEQHLREARDYRAFLALFFRRDGPWSRPRPSSFRAFADRAGFSSKAFMSDILAGRKRLTPTSFDRICSALHLTSLWRDYLHTLTALDEDSFRETDQTVKNLRSRLEQLRGKLARPKTRKKMEGETPLVRAYLSPEFPEIYAALGTTERGSDLNTISARANLDRDLVHNILLKMIAAGIVTPKDDHFFPTIDAVDVSELQSSILFRADFFRALEKAKRRFPLQCASKEALFMTQTFSVEKSRLPTLRLELARLLQSFSDEAETAEGDSVAEISVSFTHSF